MLKTFTFVSFFGAAVYLPLAQAADLSVTHLKLGMSLEQLKQSLGPKYHFVLAVRFNGLPAQEYLAINGDKDGYMFWLLNGKTEYIAYDVQYAQGEGPNSDEMMEELNKKYGQSPPNMATYWIYDEHDGNLGDPQTTASCAFGPDMGSALLLPPKTGDVFRGLTNPPMVWHAGCHKGVHTFIGTSNGTKLATRYEVHLWDQGPAANLMAQGQSAAKAAADAANEAAKKNKPNL